MEAVYYFSIVNCDKILAHICAQSWIPVNPSLANNDDARCFDWLSFKNINDWTDEVKAELIRIKMVIDKPGLSVRITSRCCHCRCSKLLSDAHHGMLYFKMV
jgi:hypothetical protein